MSQFSGTRNEAAMHVEDALVLLRHITGIGTVDLANYARLGEREEWESIIESAELSLEFLEVVS